MADISSILGGALGGAAPGAYVGSFGGPVGTTIGAILGALGGGVAGAYAPKGGNPITGYAAKTEQLPTRYPWQEAGMKQLLEQGLGNANFQNIENQARANFQTRTIPSLAERFAGTVAGPMGSSRFRGALGSAGAGLERDIAALRSQYGLQQAQMGLQPAFENIYIPQTGGSLNPLLQSLGQVAPYALNQQFSGTPGMGNIMSMIQQLSPEEKNQLKNILGL